MPAYTPQLNGVSERMNYTRRNRVRAMIIDSSVPKSFWSEIAKTAVYAITRCPTNALKKNVKPAEVWYCETPRVNNMKVFGCTALVYIPRVLPPRGNNHHK